MLDGDGAVARPPLDVQDVVDERAMRARSRASGRGCAAAACVRRRRVRSASITTPHAKRAIRPPSSTSVRPRR